MGEWGATSKMSSRVCVVVPAKNESLRIVRLLRLLSSWRRRPTVVVVANGCTDDTARKAKRLGAKVIEFDQPLGHDVGRAIGLAAVDSDIYVVVDADIVCRPIELEPYVRAVESGVDIALNRYPSPKKAAYRHPTSIGKRSLNLFLSRPDLLASSLTAVPHALSRKAVEELGPDSFMVPPVAQARAIMSGLRVEAVAYTPVGVRNPLRNPSHQLAMRKLILGDCLEAIDVVVREQGVRAGFTDLGRKRQMISQLISDGASQEVDSADGQVFRAVAIVPVRNEAAHIKLVVTRLRANVPEVCVISNGSMDGTYEAVSELGVRVKEFDEPLGHDVGRAVGCITIPARRYLFTDGDFPIARKDLLPFLHPRPRVDVALNEIDSVISPEKQTDAVSVVKRFLNIALGRADLGSASLTAVPHSIHRRVLDAIGTESLAVPPVAHVKAVLSGFRVRTVHAVDVVTPNRIHADLHSEQQGRPIEKMILGDHVEAIAYLLARRGARGGYEDTGRKRSVVAEWLAANATQKPQEETTQQDEAENGA